MPAQIIDLRTARLMRDLHALHGRAEALGALSRRHSQACRSVGEDLEALQAGLRGFVRSLDTHRRRCHTASRRLRASVDALESGDIDRMIAARDDLARHMAETQRH